MSSILERRYRLLLSAYPDAYRDTHEDEILTTLLDAADPGQVYPTPREAIGLVTGGLRTRARLAAEGGPPALWADGLRLAALLLLGSLLSDRIHFLVYSSGDLRFLLPVLLAVAIVAVVVGTTRICLAAVVLAGLGGWIVVLPGVYGGFPGWSIVLHGMDFGLPGWGSIFDYDVLAQLVVAGALFWCLLRGGHRRPWPWWLAVVTIAIPVLYRLLWVGNWGWRLSMAVEFHFPLSAFELLLPMMVLSAISLIGNDPRPSLAGGVYTVVHLVVPLSMAVQLTTIGVNVATSRLPVIPMLLLLLVLAATAVVMSTLSNRCLARSYR
jgi:hypothetical protein